MARLNVRGAAYDSIRPVLPYRQGPGAARRALDVAACSRAAHGESAHQRAAPRRPADGAFGDVATPSQPGRGRHYRARETTSRPLRRLSPHTGGGRAASPDQPARYLGTALVEEQDDRR